MSAIVPRTLALGRIEGLDGWRAGLMIGGVLLHASSWLDKRPLFDAVTLLSHTFRMGAFFAISGFFAARALAVRSPRQWLRRRWAQIGVPTLFGLAVLCPLTTAAVLAMPDHHPGLPFDWYHLWFLVALLLYAPMAAVAEWADRRFRLWGPVGRHYGEKATTAAPLLVTTGLATLLLLLVASLVIGEVGTPNSMPMLTGARSIVSYWPDFLFGFAASRSAALQMVLLRDWRSPTLILTLLALAYGCWFLLLAPYTLPDTRIWIDGMLPLIGEAIAPPAAFALILRSSARVKRLGPGLRLFADAAFTVYLAHVPVIAGLTLLAARAPGSAEAKYAVIVAATLAITLAFHHLTVRRSAWLLLLFCGKPLARAAAPVPFGQPG